MTTPLRWSYRCSVAHAWPRPRAIVYSGARIVQSRPPEWDAPVIGLLAAFDHQAAGLGILNEHAAMLPGPDLCVQQGTDNGCTTVLAGVQARSGPTPSALVDLATRPGGLSGRRRTHWWGRTGGQAACAVALTAPNNGRAPTDNPCPSPKDDHGFTQSLPENLSHSETIHYFEFAIRH